VLQAEDVGREEGTISQQEGHDLMDTLTYGLVITLVGMGGTILGLYFIVLFVELVKRLFPYRKEEGQKG